MGERMRKSVASQDVVLKGELIYNYSDKRVLI